MDERFRKPANIDFERVGEDIQPQPSIAEYEPKKNFEKFKETQRFEPYKQLSLHRELGPDDLKLPRGHWVEDVKSFHGNQLIVTTSHGNLRIYDLDGGLYYQMQGGGRPGVTKTGDIVAMVEENLVLIDRERLEAKASISVKGGAASWQNLAVSQNDDPIIVRSRWIGREIDKRSIEIETYQMSEKNTIITPLSKAELKGFTEAPNISADGSVVFAPTYSYGELCLSLRSPQAVSSQMLYRHRVPRIPKSWWGGKVDICYSPVDKRFYALVTGFLPVPGPIEPHHLFSYDSLAEDEADGWKKIASKRVPTFTVSAQGLVLSPDNGALASAVGTEIKIRNVTESNLPVLKRLQANHDVRALNFSEGGYNLVAAHKRGVSIFVAK